MGVKFVIGDFKPKKDDIVLNSFSPQDVKKKTMGDNKRVVIYAEYAGLGKKDIEYLMKNCTADVIVVCNSKKALNGVRKHKNAKVEYMEGYAPPSSPFDMAKLIVVCTDRNYVHEFLKYNKAAMYMVVKALVSNYMYFKPKNQVVVAWLDTNLYRVNPAMLWAYAAFNFKPEPQIKYMKWHWPKKETKESED